MDPTGPAPVEIAEGQAADAPGIEALSREAFDPAFREAWTARQIEQVLASPEGWLLVARDADGTLAGFALSRMSGSDAELLLCATRVGRWRQGIARRLVEAAARSAAERGARRLVLEVRETNLPARALYAACGFVQVGLRPGYYTRASGERQAALTLARDLGGLAPASGGPAGTTAPRHEKTS
ncbi:MAG: GNAT family N-acetyltransferase [Sphingomonadaceae bacterium]|uniref:GNAT family N-acetyltransferase n=1 Tax=Thermaurantiacus sp. TaxID=2820283 RepID=UPI00298F09F9|nr:GNAT family N-acetyltransferase [Thermaurantiacus sp.]MCS6985920.1 GNAT family N-acetyltransferase [Sphingomonadaceae bacterium]MDW8414864.1 GNAT family N-acetyltransferase [Thermaurantiacus sp.]